jgi:Ankyrin repeats (3 copies)/Ankyrin repeat
MKKWSQDMVKAFQFCDKSKVLNILRLGFPIETCLYIRSENSDVLINKTYCLHLSCEYGFLDVLQQLVARGGSLDTRDSFKRTPLMIACETGYLDIVKYLCVVCKVSTKGYDLFGNTILHIAAINSRIQIVQFLVEVVEIRFNTLNSSKKTALELCRDLYTMEYNSKLEEVICYLTGKSSQKIFNEISNKGYKANTFSCHDYCKKNYFQALNPGDYYIKPQSNGCRSFSKVSSIKSAILLKLPSPGTSISDNTYKYKPKTPYSKPINSQDTLSLAGYHRKRTNMDLVTYNSISSLPSIKFNTKTA